MENSFGFLPHSHSKRLRLNRERLAEHRTDGFLSLNLEVSIRADARRLFHALTDPEYLEAWVCLPGHRPECSTVATRKDRDFWIEHFCDARGSISISGTYRVCRRRDVTFSWRVDGDVRVLETEVNIRLQGDFERTSLTLRHSGFISTFDLAWHRALWDLSLGRLVSLCGTQTQLQSFAERPQERRATTGRVFRQE